MAFFLTLLYILTAFVSPPVLFGEFHQYHVEIIIALLALLSSIPSLEGSRFLELPQTKAIFTLWVFLVISVSINTSFREGGTAFYNFVPVTFTYFLTALNCKTKRHLQLIFLALFLGGLNFIVHGYLDLRANVTPSLYLYGDEGLRRLRGLGLVNDPNDFSQVLVSLVPCFYLFRTKTAIANLFTVVLPIAILVSGLYLAHSRGAAIGLMAIVILAARRKIGTVPAMVVGGALFVGSLAFGWSGGREVSMEAGADRLDAWVMGIEFIKAHPLFGIGNNRFGELNYITAHNSIVVCAAENGILGFVCWIMFVFTSMRMGVRLSSATIGGEPAMASKAQLEEKPENAWAKMLERSKQGTAEPLNTLETPAQPAPPSSQTTEDTAALQISVEEVQTMARMIVLALTGFLTAGWFLSRALTPWMFMYCGMIAAVERMATERGFPVAREPFKFLLKGAVAISAGLLVLVYGTLKIRSVMGQ
jgi:O-antigen ligase